MNQSMPWMKLPHRQYMISISRAALKPIERLAFLELAMYANTQPDRQLPDIDAALAGWAGMTTAQWVKIKDRVLAEWMLDDGVWSLPEWFDLYSDDQQTSQPPSKTTAPSKGRKRTGKAKTPAERQRDYRARNSVTDSVTDSVTRNAKVTDQNVTRNGNSDASDVTRNGNNVTNEGGKGGDLDLDLDLDLKESVCVTPCAATVSNTDPLSFTRHTLSQTGFTVLEIPKQFASLAKQRNSQLTDADLDVIWSRLLDWSSKDEQADVKRNWFNTWIARINSDAAVTIANRLKHQDTPTTATVVEAACYRTISTPVTTSTAQALTDEQQAEMQRNKSELMAKLAEDAA